jgi:hypothetical protein
VLNQADSVTTAYNAAATQPFLFLSVDGETITPATSRTRPASINGTLELDAAPRAFVLDADGSSTLDDARRDHDDAA